MGHAPAWIVQLIERVALILHKELWVLVRGHDGLSSRGLCPAAFPVSLGGRVPRLGVGFPLGGSQNGFGLHQSADR